MVAYIAIANRAQTGTRNNFVTRGLAVGRTQPYQTFKRLSSAQCFPKKCAVMAHRYPHRRHFRRKRHCHQFCEVVNGMVDNSGLIGGVRVKSSTTKTVGSR